jgi:hypothetical protein
MGSFVSKRTTGGRVSPTEASRLAVEENLRNIAEIRNKHAHVMTRQQMMDNEMAQLGNSCWQGR